MEITVLGLNHKTAPLELREKLSIPHSKAPDFMKQLESHGAFKERLLLSTCNRTELYGAGGDADSSVRSAKQIFGQYASLDPSRFEENLYVLRQPKSVEHLFSVASGLDSMVIGETEIIGQVKDAYEEAYRHRQTGKVLNTLFQRSFKVAKNVRTQTEIGVGRVGVASVAVDLASKIFEDLKKVHVMVIGTGDMASQILRALHAKGAKLMVVSSHRFDRAEELAAELGAEPVHYDFYQERMKEVDIVIASTLAPIALVKMADVRLWMRERHAKPLFLIDVAVPRNIEASSEKLDNVFLYNIDDLSGIAKKNRALRESELEECLRLVGRQTGYFMDWLAKEFGQTA